MRTEIANYANSHWPERSWKAASRSCEQKYRSSNNGKFPSLNLTHKELHGSFYNVREIVRDIIQENKVLGPGNPSSQLLNLEYYSDEEEDKGLFLDVQGNISVSTVVNGKDQILHEVVSSMEDADDQSKFCPKHDKDGVFPLVAHTFGQDSSSEAPVLLVSNTSEIFEFGQKAHLMAEPYQDGVAIEKSDLESVGLNSINSTFRMYEISIIVNNGAIPLIPFDKEYIGSDAQHGDIALFSENNVDVAESRSVDNLDLQAISLCVPGPAENDVLLSSELYLILLCQMETAQLSELFLLECFKIFTCSNDEEDEVNC
ncbi:hypothetical protein KSP40_PGU012983 [Platanthera guangdongensis]|uniref:AT3G52170-like helix-turn-helix domain-containing protein n=1 Tax=Platanthera guangdongensis TaxID=2320717 RepID=A0ABR2MBD7_9ASPA